MAATIPRCRRLYEWSSCANPRTLSVISVTCFLNAVMNLRASSERSGCQLFQLIQGDCQQGQALADVIVQVSGDASTLRLLGFNQPAIHAGQRFLRKLAVGDVHSMPSMRSAAPSAE